MKLNKSLLNENEVKEGDKLICVARYLDRKYNIRTVVKAAGKLAVNGTFLFIDSAGKTDNPSLAKYFYIKLTKLADILYVK